MSLESAKTHLNKAIHNYVDEKIIPLFQKILEKEFVAIKWTSGFLFFLSQELNIKVKESSLVQLTIKEGKVFWRITSGDTLLYDRSTYKTPFDFTNAHLISMTWEYFQLFKNSGKRQGSVAITQELFIKQFTPRQKAIATSTWMQLKETGILDHNNRLSHLWHFASSSYLTLPDPHLAYPAICTAFNTILDNSDNAEELDCIPNAILYRPDRSLKDWKTTGRMMGLDPKSPRNRVKPWDVSIFQNLNNHAPTDDGLDHDHSPSVSCLKDYRQTVIDEFYSLHASQIQLNWIANAKAESDLSWSCIVIPHNLHTQGLTYGEGKKAQQKIIKKPFFDEVKKYLDIIEQQPEQKSSTSQNDNFLRAAGAFRYMYRCQVKGKHGLIPQRFFHNINKNEIDTLFLERLEKFTMQK